MVIEWGCTGSECSEKVANFVKILIRVVKKSKIEFICNSTKMVKFQVLTVFFWKKLSPWFNEFTPCDHLIFVFGFKCLLNFLFFIFFITNLMQKPLSITENLEKIVKFQFLNDFFFCRNTPAAPLFLNDCPAAYCWKKQISFSCFFIAPFLFLFFSYTLLKNTIFIS